MCGSLTVDTGSVGTEDRAAWVCQIRIRIITGCFDDLFLIMAGSISIQGTDKLS